MGKVNAKHVIPNAARMLQAGQPAAARDQLLALLTAQPDLWDARHLLAISLFAIGEATEASSQMEQVLAHLPNRSDVWVNYVAGLSRFPELGEQLLRVANQALRRFPRLQSVWLAVAHHYEREEKLNMACQVLEQANRRIRDKADLKLAWAKLLLRSNQADRCQPILESLAAMDNPSPESLYLLGRVYSIQEKLEAACHCWSKALKLQPGHDKALENLLVTRRRCCDWTEFDALAEQLRMRSERNLAASKPALESPLVCLSIFADTQYNFRVASAAAAVIARQSGASSISNNSNARISNQRIRVGYLSDELRDHPIGHLMLDFLGSHDPDQFEIFVYNHHPSAAADETAKAIFSSVRETRHVFQSSHKQLADLICRDRVDILVDLKGWRSGNRLPALALRPCRIQASFLGYPGTTGAPFIDYLLTDEYVLPREETAYFSEKPAYLNRCYFLGSASQPSRRELASKAGSRANHSLPEKALVLTSFNQAYKLDPQWMTLWLESLHQVPSAVLWLLEMNPESRRNLRQFAVDRGIQPERLIFAPWADQQQHLARLTHADLYLDTQIYTGHTTTADALSCGVPVVCMAGSHLASRVSASLMKQVGLDDYIARSVEEYRRLMFRLVDNAEERTRIRSHLSETRVRQTLLNTNDFVRQSEDLYRQMIDIRDRGLPPEVLCSRVGIPT